MQEVLDVKNDNPSVRKSRWSCFFTEALGMCYGLLENVPGVRSMLHMLAFANRRTRRGRVSYFTNQQRNLPPYNSSSVWYR